jgi:hypothetical protein
MAPARGHFEIDRIRYEFSRRPNRRTNALRDATEQHLIHITAVVLLVGAAGWGLLFYDSYRSAFSIGPATASAPATTGNADVGRTELFATSTYAPTPTGRAQPPAAARANIAASGESAANIVAREWNLFLPVREAAQVPAPAKVAMVTAPIVTPAPAKAPAIAPPVRVAALATTTPQIAALSPAPPAIVSRAPASIEAKTSLVDFETAPFPYHGDMPGSDHPFLNAGKEDHRGHVNFRGHVYWESQTYSDDHVLLHIPPGFDPSRPAVMVVFFHGHGADLARDVRDRQRLPAQTTASGANAVIVAYSGGFGPTLAVLDRGGANSRVRGLVLLDALYAGIDQFADWIANNRSTFFVSSYTPHTEHHNADLEHLLRERSVPYGSGLPRRHLQGMVAFLPAGDVPHRDFVTHAWTDNPVADILARMDDVDPKIETAEITATKRN